MSSRIKGYTLWSPYTFLVIFWIVYLLTLIPNPIGWGSSLGINLQDHFDKYFLYTVFFLLGVIVYRPGKFNIKMGINSINRQYFFIISSFAFFFMLMSLVKAKDIPLIGNPMSRYNSSLGGFSDYPSLFLSTVAIIAFGQYDSIKQKSLNNRYFLISFFAFLLFLLMMRRQSVITVALGVAMIKMFHKTYSPAVILRYLVALICLFILIVGVMGIVRFGASSISNDVTGWELIVSIAHGEICGAHTFGAYVIETARDFFYGSYSLGSYADIFGVSNMSVGADLTQQLFTDATTAQSIAIPFSFYADFGYYGIIIFAFMSGFILNFLFLRYKLSLSKFYLYVYILYYIELLWSLRGGNLPFSPYFMYSFILLSFIFKQGTGLYKSIIKCVTFIAFSLSFLFLIIRW
jgi:oligosaccharide repeat unit polymerase